MMNKVLVFGNVMCYSEIENKSIEETGYAYNV